MADVHTSPDASRHDGPGIPLRARLPALLPLLTMWAAALLPVALFVLHQSNPQATVALATMLGKLGWQALWLLGAVLLAGFVLYPPLPAWVRRQLDRQRTKWTADRTAMARALSELKHFETAHKHFEVAKLAWIRMDYPRVAAHVQRSVALDGTLPAAQFLLGQIALHIGDHRTALAAYQNAERLDPGHAFGDALLRTAHVQHLLGDLEVSLQTFEQFHKAHGGSTRSHYWHGEALAAAGRTQDAAQEYRAAAADPKRRLTAEENWFRALARVRCWRLGGSGSGDASGAPAESGDDRNGGST